MTRPRQSAPGPQFRPAAPDPFLELGLSTASFKAMTAPPKSRREKNARAGTRQKGDRNA